MTPPEPVTLREHIEARLIEREQRFLERLAIHERAVDERFDAQDKAVAAAILSANTAVKKAEDVEEKRFESAARRIRESIDAVEKRVTVLESAYASMQGKSQGLDKGWSMLIAAVGLALSAIALFTFFASKGGTP